MPLTYLKFTMFNILFTIITLFLLSASAENILMTEVFAVKLDPSMFNWTYEGDSDQYLYQPSLLSSPDLPSWINYHYSTRYHTGFLYGVPHENVPREVLLEVVALNRKTYETKHLVIPVYIAEKLNPAKTEVHIKIDNLNVEDMFDSERMERLKDIFRKSLWKDSEEDLYLTFLASAIELGARLPVNPSDGEGVVLRLGSSASVSAELVKLEKEVKPLWKHTSCPRDFKRTTVERIFRDAGFALDWCVFRLIEDKNFAMKQHSSTSSEALSNLEDKEFIETQWNSVSMQDVPSRTYTEEYLLIVLFPLSVMVIGSLIVTIILCVQLDLIEKKVGGSRQFANHYTNTNMTAKLVRDDFVTNTKCRSSEMLTTTKGVHCRPSPPPYVRPKFKPEL